MNDILTPEERLRVESGYASAEYLVKILDRIAPPPNCGSSDKTGISTPVSSEREALVLGDFILAPVDKDGVRNVAVGNYDGSTRLVAKEQAALAHNLAANLPRREQLELVYRLLGSPGAADIAGILKSPVDRACDVSYDKADGRFRLYLRSTREVEDVLGVAGAAVAVALRAMLDREGA